MVRSIAAIAVTILLLQDVTPEEEAGALARQLRSDETGVREDAIVRLKALGKAAVPALREIASDPDPALAALAKHLLKVIPLLEELPSSLRNAVPGIEDRLAEADDAGWTREFLLAAKASVGREDLDALAERAVRGMTETELDDVCRIAARRKLLSAGPPLVEHLKRGKLTLRPLADALGKLGEREAIPALRGLLGREDAQDRLPVAIALLRMGSADAVPTLIQLFDEERWDIAARAAGALGVWGPKEAIPILVGLLTSPDEHVAWRAAEALRFADPRVTRDAVPDVIGLLKAGESGTRRRAQEVLVQWEAKEAVPELVKLLSEEDYRIQSEAIDALGQLGAREAAPELLRFLDRRPVTDVDIHLRGYAACSLGLIKDKEAVPRLVALLGDDDPSTRIWAATSLAWIGAEEAIPVCLEWLKHEDQAGVAIHVLERLGAREAEPAFLEVLRSEQRIGNRLIAGASLGWLGSRDAIPPLRELMNRSWEGRQAATTLALLGSSEGVDIILQSGDLYVLNVLRRPDIWKRLKRMTPVKPFNGTIAEILHALAGNAGMKLDLSLMDSQEEELWLNARCKSVCLPDPLDLKALVTMCRHRIVIDEGTIRLMPYPEALEFWKAWWAEERKRAPGQ